ncbi:MAG TPA: hypothetical protein VF627_12700 [Abditibacterium sp.]
MTLSPLRVAPEGRFFETFDGQSFLFLGPNDALTWPGIEPLFRRRDLAAVENYLHELKANGVTILRLMLEYAHREHRYFEKPVGRFVPNMVQLWDDLFDLCERVGLRVLLAPWDNFWMSRRWDKHPYNTRNGGPAESCGSFFTDEATIAATIARFEFLIERYANRAVLAAWDLFNEIHPYWGGDVAQQSEVIARQSAAIRAAEMRVQGWSRLQTVSIFGPKPENGYDELIFRHPSLDFCSTHIYYHGAIDLPRDTVSPALAMAKWTRYGLEKSPRNRPFLDSEHGPIHLFNDHRRWRDEDFDAEYERHLMWAHLCSGGAGSGMRWPARHPHILPPATQAQYAGLARFAELIDWRCFAPHDFRAQIAVCGPDSRAFHRFCVGDEGQFIAFFLRRMPREHRGLLPPLSPLDDLQIRVRGLQDGQWNLTFFDPLRGEIIETRELKVAGALGASLPPWQGSLALAARRLR